METKEELMLDENQYRLLMCMRMAKALGLGEIYLDATLHRMHWRMEKDGRVTDVFHSLDEMEVHLERLLENRCRLKPFLAKNMSPQLRRRYETVSLRHSYRTNGTPLVFQSRINRT